MKRREFNRTLAASALGAITSLGWPSASAAQTKPSINAARLRRNIEELSAIGRTPAGGVSRMAWTQPDIEARRWVMERLMAPIGLEVRVDPAGSIFGRRKGKEPGLPVIMFGSHIDSVTNGGIFDGPLGSLAAIEVLQSLAERRVETRRTFECVIWPDEEGQHYGNGLFGSRAAAGEIDPAELDAKDDKGVALRDGLRLLGGDPDRLREAVRRPGEVAAYLELHVEQGGVLDKAGIQIGVVEGIVGIARYQARIVGVANHAGTTPMADRHDALIAASQLVLAVREETVREEGKQVGTVGKLVVEPGVPNVVPGLVQMVIEQRDLSLEKVDRIFQRIESRTREIAAATGTQIEIHRTSLHPPAPATPWVRDLIAQEAKAAGFSTLRMPSGAGHDAQMAARFAPMGMIFVPSVGGVSHSPKELTRWEDAANGCEVLYRTVLAIDRQTRS